MTNWYLEEYGKLGWKLQIMDNFQQNRLIVIKLIYEFFEIVVNV